MPNHPAIAQPERESLTHKATLPDRVLDRMREAGQDPEWTGWYFDAVRFLEEL